MTLPRYSDLLNKAWAMMRDHLPLIAGFTALNGAAVWFLQHLPVIGVFVSFGMHAGYLVCLLKIRDGKAITFQDYLWVYSDLNRLLHYYIMHFVFVALVVVGCIFLVVPGIYIAVLLFLGSTVFVLQKPDGLESLRVTRRLVAPHWSYVFGLCILLLFLNLVGALFFLIGLLVTYPLTVLTMVILVEELSKAPNQVIDVEAKPVM